MNSDLNQNKVDKPWGYYITLYEADTYKVKLLFIEKGHSISLQKHYMRAEQWTIIKGNPLITKGPLISAYSPKCNISIEKEEEHRIAATIDDVLILELQLGNCEETDIVRLEDKYNRLIDGL